jgi:hypothetical protein
MSILKIKSSDEMEEIEKICISREEQRYFANRMAQRQIQAAARWGR